MFARIMHSDPIKMRQHSSGKMLSDFVAIFIWRRTDKKGNQGSSPIQVLLRRFEDHGWWFPCITISNDDHHVELNVERCVDDFVKQKLGISGNLRHVRNVKHYHCSLTNKKAITIVHDFELVSAEQQPLDDCKWISSDDMRTLSVDDPLINDDPQLFAKQIEGIEEKETSTKPILEILPAFDNMGDLLNLVKEQTKNDDWFGYKPALLNKSVNDNLAQIHSDFMAYCWPATEMTFATFKRFAFVSEPPVEEDSGFCLQLWRAFNPQNHHRLRFYDYFNALAMLDPAINTLPELFNVKLGMLFRFFASADKQALTTSELNALIAKLSNENNSKVLVTTGDGLVTYEAFERLIREHYLDTFTKFSFLDKNSSFKQQEMYNDKKPPSPSTKTAGKSVIIKLSSPTSKGPLEDAKSICSKSHHFRNKLNATERAKFLDILNAISKEGNQEDTVRTRVSAGPSITIRQCLPFTLQNQIITLRRASNQFSLESAPISALSENGEFVQKSEHNQMAREMLNLLNDFLTEERSSGGKMTSSVSLFTFVFKWKTQASQQQFLQLLQRLVDVCEPMLAAEPRLLTIDSPCYISGDFHGNYHDLTTLGHFLWRYGPSLCPAKLIFLGDYVDRGPNALELLGYLMAQKLLAPDRVYLIRGNHDDPKINSDFFSSCGEACMSAYGNYSNGEEARHVWLQMNRLFASMPLCAVIDGGVFCSHSGIVSPRSGFTALDDINSTIPSRLESLYDNSVAIELCWNDPMLPEHAKAPEVQHDLDAHRDGFAVNLQRSTAIFREKRILYFTAQAFRRFMTDNSLQFFVRAQESFRRGCVSGKETRTLTVSCSESAFSATVVQVEQGGRLQIIRIHTQLMIRDLKGDTTAALFEPPILNGKQAVGKGDAGKRINHGISGQKASSNPYLPPISDADFKPIGNRLVRHRDSANSFQ